MFHYSLVVDTVNGTSWGPLARYLLRTRADLLLYQEHHLGPEQIPAASALAQRLGWNSIFLPAAKGEGDGWRGGVAVLARRCIGLSPPRVGMYEVVPARVMAVLVEAPGYRPFTAISAYLEHGQGLGDRNMEIMEEVGMFIEAQGEHVPYLLGGDMQNDPAVIARLGFAQRTAASIVATRDPRGTCRSSTATTELDYFFVHNALAAGIESVATVEGAGTTPHVPVRLRFKPRLASARTLVLRKPPPIGTERVFGPLLQPPDWGPLAARAAALAACAQRADFSPDDAFRSEYSALYQDWADLAEEEIDNATTNDVPSKKAGLRGRSPVLVWRSVQHERPPPPPTHQVELDRWRTAAMLINEIRGTLLWMCPATDDERWVPRQEREQAGMPIPAGLGGPVTANLITKLASIRDQLDTDRDLTTSDEAADDHGTGMLSYAEANCRIHALACAAEIAIRTADGPTAPRGDEDEADELPRHARLIAVADRLQGLVQEQLKRVTTADRTARREGWRNWILENIANGARNAHRYLRMPAEWRPTTALTVDGVVTADPAVLLQTYSTKYDALWNGASGAEGGRGGDNGRAAPPWVTTRTEPLPTPTPAELRAASRSFRCNTATAYDGIPMRAYDLLSDAALNVVGVIFAIMETTGLLPMQLDMVEMPMIEKAKGGHRAVATLVSLYRLWAKVRKPMLTQWEQKNDRPYLASGKGRSPQTAVWRQACHAEAAVGEGYHSATLLWDLSSFFEAVRREPLWHRARKLGFPLPLLKVALGVYGSVRVLSLGGMLSAPIPSNNGVLAGCGLAMALTRAYVIGPLDAVVANFGPSSPLPARLDIYVDDLAIAAEGKMHQVILRLTNAAELVQEVIEGPLHCSIEVGKAAVVTSSKPLTDILKNRFGNLAGAQGTQAAGLGDGPSSTRQRARRRVCTRRKVDGRLRNPAAPNLGIDYAAGQKRSAHGRRCRRAQRLARLNIKTARLARIRSIAGRRAPLIFLSGPLPEATYGAAVNGLSDREALAVRRNAAQAFTPRARGRSLSRLLLLVGMPTWRAEVEVILEYARQVWQASLLGSSVPVDGTLTLPELSRIWSAVSTQDIITHEGARRNWSAVRGPIGAMWLSLHRIGWTMSGPFTLVNRDRDELMLTTTSPAMLAQLLRQAVIHTLQLQVGEKIAETDDAFCGRRVAVEHIAAQLKSDRRLSARDKAAYMSVACGALMTHSRAVAEGYLVLDLCPLCGMPGDTITHRVWRCAHHAAVQAREAAAPRWFLKELERATCVEGNVFWSTAFLPHPADIWPAPAAEANMCCEWVDGEAPQAADRGADGGPLLSGSVYVDGSCTTHVFPELRRAATSVIQRQSEEHGGWRLQLPIPRPLPQTPQSAEYATMVLVRRYAHPSKPMDVASDCANVVRDINLPPMLAMAGRKMYAGLLREVVTDREWARRATVRKVPAHVSPSSLPPGPARSDAIGNGIADLSAKEAVGAHPSPSPTMQQDLESALRRAKIVVRTIAAVIQCFPPMPRERMQRPPVPADGARVAVGDGHRWVFASGFWRCEVCLRLTLRQQIDGTLAHQKCPGRRTSMNEQAMENRGHTLARTEGAIPIIFCVRCGAWSTRRAYSLSAKCRGAPTPAGRQALARIARGYQPWEDRNADYDNRRSRGIRCTRRRGAVDTADAPARRRGQTSVPMPANADGGSPESYADSQRPLSRRDDDVDPYMAVDDLDSIGIEEDVFGHGGQLDQSQPADSYADARGPLSAAEGACRGAPVSHGQHEGATTGDTDDATQPAEGEPTRDVVPRRDLRQHYPQARRGDDQQGARATLRDVDARDADGFDDRGTAMQRSVKRRRRGSDDGDGRPTDDVIMEEDVIEEESCRVEATDTDAAQASVVVAREGPGGAPHVSATVAAVPPSSGAAATVATCGAAAELSLGDAARSVTECGEAVASAVPAAQRSWTAAANPPDGCAAPSDDSAPVTSRPRGRDSATSQAMSPSANGGRPCKRRRSTSSQAAPGRLGARPSTSGSRSLSGEREPTPGDARRRVGSDAPAASSKVARCSGVATWRRDWEQPQWGWARHRKDAHEDECSGMHERGEGDDVVRVGGGRAVPAQIVGGAGRAGTTYGGASSSWEVPGGVCNGARSQWGDVGGAASAPTTTAASEDGGSSAVDAAGRSGPSTGNGDGRGERRNSERKGPDRRRKDQVLGGCRTGAHSGRWPRADHGSPRHARIDPHPGVAKGPDDRHRCGSGRGAAVQHGDRGQHRGEDRRGLGGREWHRECGALVLDALPVDRGCRDDGARAAHRVEHARCQEEPIDLHQRRCGGQGSEGRDSIRLISDERAGAGTCSRDAVGNGSRVGDDWTEGTSAGRGDPTRAPARRHDEPLLQARLAAAHDPERDAPAGGCRRRRGKGAELVLRSADAAGVEAESTVDYGGGRAQPGEPVPIWMRPPSWMYLPHLHPPGVTGGGGHGEQLIDDGTGAAGDAHDGERRPIRGRHQPPGAGNGAGPAAAIRGPHLGLGPSAAETDARSRAQRRLDAQNAHLRLSLEAHAERVATKRGQNAHSGVTQSAADRLNALRRRVADRASARSIAGRGHAAAAAPETGGEPLVVSLAAGRNELHTQIHSSGEGTPSLRDASACRESSSGAAGDHCAGSGWPATSSDAAHAASRVAWHDVELVRAAEDGYH